MPKDGQYDRHMYNVLTKLIKFVVVGISRYVSFNMIHRNGMNTTTIDFKSLRYSDCYMYHLFNTKQVRQF
jgi:hypothetical protein